MKKRIDVIISLLIIVFELYAFSRTIILNNRMGIEYYTVVSNLLTFISSILYLYFYKQRNKCVNILYYITTCMMTLTFLVVFFILAPMYDFDYYWLMFKGSNLFMHTICPALIMMNYIFLNKEKNRLYQSLIMTFVYGIIIIPLILFKVVEAPYPFLEFDTQPFYMTILWLTIIVLLNLGIGWLLIKLNKKLGVKYEY